MNRRSIILGRVVVTTCMQGSGAPVIDRATVHAKTGQHFRGWAVLLKPWRRRTDATVRSRALVIGIER